MTEDVISAIAASSDQHQKALSTPHEVLTPSITSCTSIIVFPIITSSQTILRNDMKLTSTLKTFAVSLAAVSVTNTFKNGRNRLIIAT